MTEETKVAPGQPVDPTAAPAPASEANGQAAPDLNLNDLSALRSILDVASSRGAFKAAEMEAVGKQSLGQDDSVSQLSSLNSKLEQLISINHQLANINNDQLRVQKGFSFGDMFKSPV